MLNYTLADYKREHEGYQTSYFQKFRFLLNGAPYANRHWQLGNKEGKWGHRTIAVIEYCPIIGSLAALFERLVVSCVARLSPESVPLPLQKKVQVLNKEEDLPPPPSYEEAIQDRPNSPPPPYPDSPPPYSGPVADQATPTRPNSPEPDIEDQAITEDQPILARSDSPPPYSGPVADQAKSQPISEGVEVNNEINNASHLTLNDERSFSQEELNLFYFMDLLDSNPVEATLNIRNYFKNIPVEFMKKLIRINVPAALVLDADLATNLMIQFQCSKDHLIKVLCEVNRIADPSEVKSNLHRLNFSTIKAFCRLKVLKSTEIPKEILREKASAAIRIYYPSVEQEPISLTSPRK